MPNKSGLTPQQIQQFHDDGLLTLRNLLPRADMQPLIDELAQRVDDGAKTAVERGVLRPSDTFEDAPFETRLALLSEACSERDWIWKNHFREQKPRSAGMFTLRTSPPLLDVVESLIGGEILAHPQFNFRAKLPAHEVTVIPWHQDLAYLIPEEAGETLVLNLWIPLVNATAENGCMQVIRGSHCFNLLPHNYRAPTPGHTGSKGISEDELPPGEVVTAALDVGDVLLTTERLVHRGIPNLSQTVRWSVDTRYCQIGLPTGRENVPGFVARSRKHPDRVAKSVDDWHRVFEGR
jgi:phytanoyl-CoA hydroxylase